MRYIFEDRNLLILFASTFMFFTNEALLLPTLPVHLSSIGYSNTQIGIVLGAFALGVLLFRPLSGYVTDQKSRKLSLVIGVSIFLAAPAFYLFSDYFPYLVIIRFFNGLGITFYTTAMPAFITDVAPEDKRGEILGHMANASTLSFMLGPLTGVYVFSTWGFFGLIMACILAGFINLAVILFIQEQYHRTEAKQKVRYKNVVFKRSILVSSFINLMYAIIFGGIMTFLPVLLKQTGNLTVGPFFLVESVTIILCRMLTAHLTDRIGRGPVFVFSFVILLVAVFLVSKINTFMLLILVGALFGCGYALCGPALAAFVTDETGQEARGAVFGFFYGAFDAGVIIAGVVLGFIADLTGLRDMFVMTSIGGMICLVIFVTTIKEKVAVSIKWALAGK